MRTHAGRTRAGSRLQLEVLSAARIGAKKADVARDGRAPRRNIWLNSGRASRRRGTNLQTPPERAQKQHALPTSRSIPARRTRVTFLLRLCRRRKQRNDNGEGWQAVEVNFDDDGHVGERSQTHRALLEAVALLGSVARKSAQCDAIMPLSRVPPGRHTLIPERWHPFSIGD